MIETLLEIRRKLKERKPEFIRQDNPKRMKLSYKWRKPKGIHSKIRHHFKGRRKMPSPGYKSPIKVRGLHHSGLKIVKVYSVEDITKTKQKVEGVVVSKSVGMRKRLEIFKKAKELKITILNLNLDEQIKKIENFINSKKTKSKKDNKEQATKVTSKPKEEVKEVPKKDVEKKEKDKLLTKRM